MAEPQLSIYGNVDEKHVSDDSLEKNQVASSIDDAEELKEMEDLEKRLENDEATEDEYRVEEAHEVAIKVGGYIPHPPMVLNFPQVLSTRDDPSLQSITFRTVILGLGFSAFGA